MHTYTVSRIPLTESNAKMVRLSLMDERLDRDSSLYGRFERHHKGLVKALDAISLGYERKVDRRLMSLTIETHDLGKLLPENWRDKKPKALRQFASEDHALRSWEYCKSRFSGTFPSGMGECIKYHGNDYLNDENHPVTDARVIRNMHVFQLIDALGNYYAPLLEYRMNANRNGDAYETLCKSHKRVLATSSALLGKIDVNWNAVHAWIKENSLLSMPKGS